MPYSCNSVFAVDRIPEKIANALLVRLASVSETLNSLTFLHEGFFNVLPLSTITDLFSCASSSGNIGQLSIKSTSSVTMTVLTDRYL